MGFEVCCFLPKCWRFCILFAARSPPDPALPHPWQSPRTPTSQVSWRLQNFGGPGMTHIPLVPSSLSVWLDLWLQRLWDRADVHWTHKSQTSCSGVVTATKSSVPGPRLCLASHCEPGLRAACGESGWTGARAPRPGLLGRRVQWMSLRSSA